MSALPASVGARIRQARVANGLGQIELAEHLGVASGSISKIENGRFPAGTDLLTLLSGALEVSENYLLQGGTPVLSSRPWLRAYADAPKLAVDRHVAICGLATHVSESLGLRTIPDTVPGFDGDPTDVHAIEAAAAETRAAAQLGEADVVGNAIRAAERLGCFVLPMPGELGRHLGMSIRANASPMICVSRPAGHNGNGPPGDRQRFTVAHELGHLVLHATMPAPTTAVEATTIEKQAHLFAGAFLAPGDALIEDLDEHGNGRVTLKTLAALKANWGMSIKALVARFRSMSVIDDHHARSLYKQISARGWNLAEPVPVGTEEAIWFRQALKKRFPDAANPLDDAARLSGIGIEHLEDWTTWGPPAPDTNAEVIDLRTRKHRST